MRELRETDVGKTAHFRVPIRFRYSYGVRVIKSVNVEAQQITVVFNGYTDFIVHKKEISKITKGRNYE